LSVIWKKARPETERLVELARDPKENDKIALGAVMAVENIARTTRKKDELEEAIKGLEIIAKNPRKSISGKVVKEALTVAVLRRSTMPLWDKAKIAYELTPLMQFGLCGIGANDTCKQLTYSSRGSTNKTTLRIDKDDQIVFGSDEGRWNEPRAAPLPPRSDKKQERLGIRSVWEYPWDARDKNKDAKDKNKKKRSIRVTQVLEIVQSEATNNNLDTCLIGYIIENAGAEAVSVSLNCEIDTNIDGNDANPFAIPGPETIAITKPALYKTIEIPSHVIAMKNADPEDPGFSGYFSFLDGGKTSTGRGLEKLSRFLIQNLWALSSDVDAPDYTLPPNQGQLRDSAVALYWAPMRIQPGESRRMAYAYGLGTISLKSLSPQRPFILYGK
jgi:hypothetical protein